MTYDELKAALMNRTVIVEIEEGPAYATTGAMMRDRQKAMERRECVAYLYTKKYDAERAAGGLPRAADVEMPVTLEQARELMKLGAKWVGVDPP